MEFKIDNIEKFNIDFSFRLKEKGKINLSYTKIDGNKLLAEKYDVLDEITYEKYGSGYIFQREITNLSNEELLLNDLIVEVTNLSFGGISKNDFFYHPENARIYGVFTFPIDYIRTKYDALNSEYDLKANNRWADPGVVSEKIGNSPYQPYPAILIGNYDKNIGFVHGTLSQDVFFHNYILNHENGKIKLIINSSFKCIEYRVLKPKEVLKDEFYIGSIKEISNIQNIFLEHTDILRKKIVHRFKDNTNKYNLVWGSWNDGIFRNISEEMLLNEVDIIKEYFPLVKWIQLDDGYSTLNNTADGISVPYKKHTQIDKSKFPNGLKSYTDKIKEKGLRPSIWIGGYCPKEAPLYKEHKDWFIDYSYRFVNSAPFDLSNAKAREYMKYALDVLITEYGFEGVKHDFWSYSFEDSNDFYQNKNKSGYEYRKWWLEEIRKRLPEDGYLQSCCDLVMGNIFYGEYFNNYRYGIDIGEGDWENIKANYLWGTVCLATKSGDIIIPNGDGIGILSCLNDLDFEFLINYLITAHSLVELAGKFSNTDKTSKRFKILQKAVCCINNGEDVYFVDGNYINNISPSIMYFNTPQFSLLKEKEGLPIKTVGIFNIEEKNKEINFNIKDLKLKKDEYILYDMWSGEIIDFNDSYNKILLPHESRLYSVIEKNSNCLYDSNIKIDNVKCIDNGIIITTAYGGNGKFVFSKNIKTMIINGKKCDAKIVKNIAEIKLNKKEEIEIYFE